MQKTQRGVLLGLFLFVLGWPLGVDTAFGQGLGEAAAGSCAVLRLVSADAWQAVQRQATGPQSQQLNNDLSFRRKSPALAFLLSAIVPGSGEVYLSAKWGLFFTGLEAIGWTSYILLTQKGNQHEEEVMDFADKHWDLSKFRGSPFDTEEGERLGEIGSQQYYEQIGKYEKFSIGWDDPAERTKYVVMREDMNRYFKRATLAAGILLFNHVVSAIDAARLAVNHNQAIDQARQQIRLELRPGLLAQADWPAQMAQPRSVVSPSPVRAALLSLALPGAGQWYAGAPQRGRLFMGWEMATWAGFAAFQAYGHWRREDYKVFAAVHAGVNPQGQSERFFEDILAWPSRTAFNQEQRLLHRHRARTYPPEADWRWESETDRKQYDRLWESSRRAFVRSGYLLGMALFNRLASAIDAAHTAAHNNQGRRQGTRLHLASLANPLSRQMGLILYTHFY